MTKYVVDLLRDPQCIKEDLKHLRIWLDGYKANGGDMPLGVDVIRQLQVVMSNVQAPTSGDDNTAARARVIDGFDGIQDILDKAVQSFLDYDKAIGLPVPQPKKPSGNLWRMMVKRPGDDYNHLWMQMASSTDDARTTFMKHHPGYTIHSITPA